MSTDDENRDGERRLLWAVANAAHDLVRDVPGDVPGAKVPARAEAVQKLREALRALEMLGSATTFAP